MTRLSGRIDGYGEIWPCEMGRVWDTELGQSAHEPKRGERDSCEKAATGGRGIIPFR